MEDRFKFRVWSYEDNRFIEDYNFPAKHALKQMEEVNANI